jgi:hypothetical protein
MQVAYNYPSLIVASYSTNISNHYFSFSVILVPGLCIERVDGAKSLIKYLVVLVAHLINVDLV